MNAACSQRGLSRPPPGVIVFPSALSVRTSSPRSLPLHIGRLVDSMGSAGLERRCYAFGCLRTRERRGRSVERCYCAYIPATPPGTFSVTLGVEDAESGRAYSYMFPEHSSVTNNSVGGGDFELETGGYRATPYGSNASPGSLQSGRFVSVCFEEVESGRE